MMQAVLTSMPTGSRSRQQRATITPARATVEPMDRSIKPAIMTMVMPRAITPFMELLRRMFIQLSQVMNLFAPRVRPMIKSTKKTSMMWSSKKRTIFLRLKAGLPAASVPMLILISSHAKFVKLIDIHVVWNDLVYDSAVAHDQNAMANFQQFFQLS